MTIRLRTMTAVVALGAALGGASAVHAGGALRTAVYEPQLAADSLQTEFARMHGAGASLVRITVNWAAIAASAPAAAADPDDPAYAWSALDGEVAGAVDAGLQPILDVLGAPPWAVSGGHPQLGALSDFSHAVAERYSGRVANLPRVRYWQLWNEPNLNAYIEPQFSGTTPVSPGIYRSMANTFTTAIKGVAQTNTVIIGGLAPYGIQQKGQPINKVLSVAPLTFMRALLCISAGSHPHATCNAKVKFDVFSVHPYTWGGPTHSAFSSDDVAIGDLPEVQQVLRDAWRLHRIAATRMPPLWVTEFSWDTNPPDPHALPIAIQARWTSEALYHMWSDGIGVVTWFLLRDEPYPATPFQSGLYFAGETVAQDKPKPTLTAFRFPFVAYPGTSGTLVWGRTPDSAAHTVLVERRAGSGWQRVATLKANRFGIFQSTLPLTSRTGYMRARVVGDGQVSLPFGLKAVPDRRISPFGS
jgi:hypothetical protein